MQVVTLDGFRSVSAPFPAADTLAPGAWWHHAAPRWFLTAEIYAPFCCLLLPWIWLHPQRLWRRPRFGRDRGLAGFLSLPWLLCAPMLVVSVIVAGTSALGVSRSLAYAIAALEVLGVWGLWRCERHLRRAARAQSALAAPNHRLAERGRWLAAWLALAAAPLAGTPLIWSLRPAVLPAVVDRTALIALGFDAASGLAFFLVVITATLVLLATSAGIATGSSIANRHARLLTPEQPAGALADDPFYRPLSSLPALLAAAPILILALPGLLDALGGARLTIFDRGASTAAFCALAATTFCAAVLLCGAAGIARRIVMICGYVHNRVAQLRKPGVNGEIPGLWARGPTSQILAVASSDAVTMRVPSGE
jgi:hypothetical protein